MGQLSSRRRHIAVAQRARRAVTASRDTAVWVPALFTGMLTAVFFLAPNPMIVLGVTLCLAFASFWFEWDVMVSVMLVASFLVAHVKIALGGWSTYVVQDVVAVMVLLRWGVGRIQTGQSLFSKTPVSAAFLALVAYLLLELVNPHAPIERSVLGFRSWLMYTMFLFVGYDSYKNAAQVARLYRVLLGLGIGTAVFGIWQWQEGNKGVQYLAMFGERYWRYASKLNWSSIDGSLSVFRAFSTFVTPSAFASNMAIIITIATGLALSSTSSKAWRVTSVIGIVLMGAAIAVSGSRSGPAYLLASFLVMLVLLRQINIAIPVLIGGFISIQVIQALSGAMLVERFATLLSPDVYLYKWGRPFQAAISGIPEYPLGHGLGFTVGLPQFVTPGGWVEDVRTGAVVDSGYGAVIAELGFPGLALYCWFTIQLALSVFSAWHRIDKDQRNLLLGPAAYAISLPIMSGLTPPQAFLPAASYTWLFMGMVLAAGARAPAPQTERHIDRVRLAVPRRRAALASLRGATAHH